MKPSCAADSCDDAARALGFCDKHYRRLKKYGDPTTVKVEQHGCRKTAEYGIWSHIIGRCLNPGDASYKHYGARGIEVCNRWKSFGSFLEDMGKRPTPKHQIDRIDNDGPYAPYNCHWVLSAENNQNRRSTKLNPRLVAEIRGSTETGAVLAERYGISISQALRVRSGKRWRP